MALGFVDVSNHQAGIDLTRVDNPAPYIFIKVTEGRGFVDKYWRGFADTIRGLGKIPGFYHFVSQGNAPEPEAANFVNQLRGYIRPGEVICLDWEPIGNNPSPRNVEWARRWMQLVEPELQRRPWIYMNLSMANGAEWGDIATNNPLWLAHYPNNNPTTNGYNPAGQRGAVGPQWRNLIAWQFTDNGRLAGYGNNLDLNLYYGTPTAPGPSTPPPVIVNAIPPMRETDAPESYRDSNGRTWRVCLCMKLTLPLVEAEMKRRGIIRYSIDIFQGGYNAGGVAASAGTHDMGGVIDVLQGISLEQRKVWAMFGVMMFPRIREFGWTTGDHGHGVWHGCPHQTGSADAQVRNGISGFDGLVSNTRRNFEAPARTWQEAYLEAVSAAPPVVVTPARAVPNDVWAAEQLTRLGFTLHTDYKLNLREFQMVYMGRYHDLEVLDEDTVTALKGPRFASSLQHATEFFTPMDVRMVRYAQLKLKVAPEVSATDAEMWNSDFSYRWSKAAYVLGLMNWQAIHRLELQWPMSSAYWEEFARQAGVFDPVP